MTNDTSTTNTDDTDHTNAVVIRGLTDSQVQLINETIIQLEETNTDIHSETVTIENTEWNWDSPCTHCGCETFTQIRGKEEQTIYNTETESVDYQGRSTRTALMETEIITVICRDCSKILWDTLEHNTLSQQTI